MAISSAMVKALRNGVPWVLHNSAHFGSAIHNFYRSESALGRATRHVEKMVKGNPPIVKNSQLTVPTAPGLGLDFDFDYLKSQLVPGEPWWG